jgi:hypothetical protein
MATAVKNYRTLVAAGTANAVGATTTGTAWNLTTAFGGVMTAVITNGATGPTIACDFVIQISGDGVAWKEFTRQTAGTAANGSYNFSYDLPVGVMYARPIFQNNTGQPVTVEAFGQELTSIA